MPKFRALFSFRQSSTHMEEIEAKDASAAYDRAEAMLVYRDSDSYSWDPDDGEIELIGVELVEESKKKGKRRGKS